MAAPKTTASGQPKATTNQLPADARSTTTPRYEIVTTPKAIISMIDLISPANHPPPKLYVDLEGISLSRHGSISWLQIHASEVCKTFLVDVHILGSKAFSTPTNYGTTLSTILGSRSIQKYFFDVRNDADALFALFGVKLDGVRDVQLLEIAGRSGPKTYVNGLARCIEKDCPLPSTSRQAWLSGKAAGAKLFDPKFGGSYEVFNQRPMTQSIVDYCVRDVECLPALAKFYESRLAKVWLDKVELESRKRLQEAMAPGYNPKADSKKFAPQGWLNPTPTDPFGYNDTMDEDPYDEAGEDDYWSEDEGPFGWRDMAINANDYFYSP